MKTLHSQFTSRKLDLQHFGYRDVVAEPQMQHASVEFARQQGGKIINCILDQMPDFNYSISIKIAQPPEGVYCSIPGWHSDSILMNRSTNDTMDLEYNVLWIGNTCPTLFAIGDHTFDDILKGVDFWRYFNNSVEQAIDDGTLQKIVSEDCTLYSYDHSAIHSASQSERGGVRMFVKMVRLRDNTHLKYTNYLQNQNVMYMRL